MRQATTIQFIPNVRTAIQTEADLLNMSLSNYVNNLCMKNILKSMSDTDILGVIEDLAGNMKSVITRGFRDNIIAMPVYAQREICEFIIGLNLIADTKITTNKAATLWKHENTICYFVFNQIRNQTVEQCIPANLVVKTIGAANSPDYVYFSKYQWLRTLQPYPLWNEFLRNLNIPANTGVLRVEPSQLVKIILPAIEQL